MSDSQKYLMQFSPRVKCAGQSELCLEFWDEESVASEPLQHFLHTSRDLFPAVRFTLRPHTKALHFSPQFSQ